MVKKFSEYEVVKVISNETPALKRKYGEYGIILGFTFDAKGKCHYGVMFEEGVLSIQEDNLKSTGSFASSEDVYTGEHLKISVDSNERGDEGSGRNK
jgi:hypothetical protein